MALSGRSPEKKRPAAMTTQRPTAVPQKPIGIPQRPTGANQQSALPQSPTKAPKAQPRMPGGPGKVMGTVADLARGRKPERAPPPQAK